MMDEKLRQMEEELNKNLEQILSEKESLKTETLNVRKSQFFSRIILKTGYS